MFSILRARAPVFVLFFVVVGALAGGIWRYGYVQALGQLEQRGAADLRLAADRLTRDLKRFQELVVLVAEHPDLSAIHRGADPAAGKALLLEAADKTSARNLTYVDKSGAVLVQAHDTGEKSYAHLPYFQRAMQGALGAHHEVNAPAGSRSFFFAAPSFDAQGQARGALVAEVDVNAIEFEWRGGRPAVFFTDEAGLIFVSNRTELLLWQGDARGQYRTADGTARPHSVWQRGSFEIWQTTWGPYIPARALHVTLPLPVIGLQGEALIDVRPALRLAGLQAAVVAALCLAAGALLFLVAERRRVLARDNLRLEARVQSRTVELRRAVAQLQAEVTERQQAQAALTRAQAELVQAGKLSALGRMSAGISHELNQPLMAIRSFAENAGQFLDRGETGIAADNLARISDLSRRMGRIIKNLRAFARNESEAMSNVDLVTILAGALDLNAVRRDQSDITLDWVPPEGPVWVRGGEVRLGQVFLNLISNACDAMVDRDRRILTLGIERDAERVRVTVADTGPGIAAPDRIFDPFYSTKEVGASEGMGLGLSISYGLVQSFGGDIKGETLPQGGARFTVELNAAADASAGAAA